MTGAVFAPEALTEDTLIDGRVRLAQPRRGYRAAIDPSRMLMWTSSTKQSIPSPRSRAVLKATAVGSVVRRISRIARD